MTVVSKELSFKLRDQIPRDRNLWATRVGFIIIFLMIFSTGANQGIRYSILFSILFMLSMKAMLGSARITLRVVPILGYLSLYYITLGLIYAGYGLVLGNPGAVASVQAYVIYPAILLLALQFSNNERFILGLPYVFVLSGIAVSLYGFSLLGSAAGITPSFLAVDIGLSSTIFVDDENFGMGLSTVMPMLFIVPFSIALLTLKYLEGIKLNHSFLIIVTIGFGILFSILTGRRTLWLVIALSPFLTISFYSIKLARARLPWRAILVIIIFVVFGIFYWDLLTNIISEKLGFDMNERLRTVFEIFSSNKDASIQHKQDQSVFMLNAWGDQPLFGYGHGATVQGILSSDETSWAYEASYVLLLHNTGLIGFIAYSVGIAWIYMHAILIIKRVERLSNLMIATMVGFSCFLIANSTNPYFGKIDSIWVLFFPLAIINMVLMNKSSQAGQIINLNGRTLRVS